MQTNKIGNQVCQIFSFQHSKSLSQNLIFIVWTIILLLPSCVEEIPEESYYTFKGETAGQYITNRPESYSEFALLLKKSGVMPLLNAYGKYTCFVPSNEGMKKYYEAKGKTLDDFTVEELREIAFDHIIKGFEVTSKEFVNGASLLNQTMSGRNIKVDFEGLFEYRLNSSSLITESDVEVHNGLIHIVDNVIIHTALRLDEVILADEKFKLFAEALVLTGFDQKLTPIEDESYVPPVSLPNGLGGTAVDGEFWTLGRVYRIPQSKKYGFTALMPSDLTLNEKYGITDIEGIKNKASEIYDEIYPQDAGISDPTDPRNSLNRFIGYHLIAKKLPWNLFIYQYFNSGSTPNTGHAIRTFDMFEYMEPMCANTLIEVRTLLGAGDMFDEFNVFNMVNDDPTTGVRINRDNYDNDAINGIYHEIDDILVYSPMVEQMLASKRLRMNPASFFYELTNNRIRIGHGTPEYPSQGWFFPQGYFERFKGSNTSALLYCDSDDRWPDYMGDEVRADGLYDFEAITLPIPKGTYEVRFGYHATNNRGVAQLYFDDYPVGIPLDLRILASDPKIGYVRPGTNSDDPYGYENDKAMRNRGYMKAPATFKTLSPTYYGDAYNSNVRYQENCLRRILGIFTFDEMTTHSFRAVAVKSGQFHFDWLEFVPLEVLEYEDIY